jgi:cytochrome P450
LIQNPAQMESFRALPSLAESAVEEFLRYVSPIQKLSRWTSERALFGQWAVPRGTLVTALIGAANRDPAVFEHPQELDIRRSPNRHLALGRGIHSCLGAVLARLESRVAISGLLGEYARIEAVDYRWRANSSLRCLEYLSVALR